VVVLSRWGGLKGWFARFVHSRALHRHYRRSPSLHGLIAAGRAPEPPATLAQGLLAASDSDADSLLIRLHSSRQGLSAARAATVRRRLGPNAVQQVAPLPAWRHLWRCYRNPFNLLLSALAAVSQLTGDERAALVIGAMVALSTLLRFGQEYRSHQAADRLKSLVSTRATVLRPPPQAGEPPRPQEVPVQQLVPGDVVHVSAGDMMPADLRLLSATNLFVNLAAMSGESLPVERFATLPGTTPAGANPLERHNLLFMGTSVVSGSATALVVGTGSRTYLGALTERAVAAEAPDGNAFQQGINRVSWLLIRFMAVMVPAVLLLNGFTKHDWLQALLFALAIAVGLTPEMLPMIATTTLAKGAVLLARRKVIVKRLDAIQTLGAMDVLCTDKTGTLTQDRIALKQAIDAFGQPSDEVLRWAYLNSHFQTGLKNLLDVAVLQHADLHHTLVRPGDWQLVDEIPFDFQRRRMSVVLAQGGQAPQLVCKGAIEEVLAACSQVQQGDAVRPLAPDELARIAAVTARLNDDGLRVVAVARKTLPAPAEGQAVAYRPADETGLTLLGYIAFLDPPKDSTAPALAALRAHGVAVKILTGDNDRVTRKVCRDVGLPDAPLLLGSDIEAMDAATLAVAVESTALFAKLTPAHKDRVVQALRANGHVVGYLGDGINDAGALRAADVGISVDSAVDIAKDAADIILLEKSLLVLDDGVIEGRKTFANLLKYIRMTASSNFGNVLSVLVASAFLPFLPMLPMHLLVQNLLYDISQVGIPFDRVDAEQLAAPQRWQPAELGRFMLVFGPISSLFDLATFALMAGVFGASTAAQQTLFQSGWFVEGLLTQALVVHMIRTRRLPFVQSRSSGFLLACTVAVMLLGAWLPMGPLAGAFKLQPLPPAFFAWLLVLLAGYMVVAQLGKGWYARRYGWS
jgi:Mg2+-importing ATPase